MTITTVALGLIFALLSAACLVVWSMIIRRWRSGKAAIEREPRRNVPWGGLEVLACLLIGFLLPVLVAGAADGLLERPAAANHDSAPAVDNGLDVVNPDQSSSPGDSADEEMESTAHPVARLLSERHDLATLFICAFAAVLVAPLVEEFFFRVLLQGWLEAREEAWFTPLPAMKRLPRGSLPILLSAVMFALLHARGEQPQFDAAGVMRTLVAGAGGGLAAVGMAMLLLRITCRASMADLGLSWKKLRGDASLGIAGLAAVLLPVYALQRFLYELQGWLRDSHLASSLVAPDPVPLFFLALVLGYLYQRTHRLTSSVVLHMTFNAIPLAILWFSTAK